MMPTGLLVMLPLPAPWSETVSVWFCTAVLLNCTVTLALLVPGGIVQLLLVPLQAPLQPTKPLPAAACAVKVTALVLAKLAEVLAHPSAQLKPPGSLLTLPVPVPLLLRVTQRFVAATLKVAVTLRALSMLTVQEPLLKHAPLQPAKLLPEAGSAVKVTCVPAA